MNNISVKVVADTIYQGTRIVSVEAEYPRFILPQLNTHRLLARSSASSRAIPVAKRISQVNNDPVMPAHWGVNRPGMQAVEELHGDDREKAEKIWKGAAAAAAEAAAALEKLGVHKQVANRLLEPFVTVRTVITATEWNTFFKLRLHDDAQPEMQQLANAIYDEIEKSSPISSMYHLPYVSEYERTHASSQATIFKASAARCARVSYKHHDGRKTTVEEDVQLANRLLDAGHMSPFDHPAICAASDGVGLHLRCRQFRDFVPLRALIEPASYFSTLPTHEPYVSDELNWLVRLFDCGIGV